MSTVSADTQHILANISRVTITKKKSKKRKKKKKRMRYCLHIYNNCRLKAFDEDSQSLATCFHKLVDKISALTKNFVLQKRGDIKLLGSVIIRRYKISVCNIMKVTNSYNNKITIIFFNEYFISIFLKRLV